MSRKKDEQVNAENSASEATSFDTVDKVSTTEGEAEKTATVAGSASKNDEVVFQAESVKIVAVSVRLSAIHPQASYGRCGYRFNKETAVRILVADLADGQLSALEDDPYLECDYEAE